MNTKTIEFINKAKKIHGNRYGYNEVNYINNHTKVVLYCEIHGLFMQTPSKHLSGSNCRKCAHSMTTEEFITKANEVHNGRYGYLNTVYKSSKEKVQINCSVHGNYLQNSRNHLNGSGCPKCANNSRANKLITTTEQFIEKSIKVHGDKYDYSEVDYKGVNNKVKIFCNVHGHFLQAPDGHLNGNGCMKCGKNNVSYKMTKTTDQFIYEANLVHEGKYVYDQSKYVKGTEKIDILCNNHGLFKQTPNNHIKGQGCPKCKNDKNIGGFGKNDYIKRANDRTCIFYTLRCFNDNEEFYKIGITVQTIQNRYNHITKMPYLYEIISEIYGEAGAIWDLELSEKRKLKDLKYEPSIAFRGSKTECFTSYKVEV